MGSMATLVQTREAVKPQIPVLSDGPELRLFEMDEARDLLGVT